MEILVPRVEEAIAFQESSVDPNLLPISEPPFSSSEPITLPPQTISQQQIDFGQSFPDQRSIDFGQPLSRSGSQRSIEFGQPLPRSGNQRSIEFGQPLPGERSLLVLEEGDTLQLVFPRGADITLPRGVELQEVLLLRSAIVDGFGNIIVPAQTPVIGGFESSRRGSRFIARALYLYGRSIPFPARSDIIEGRRRVNPKVLAGATAVGGLALLLLTDSGLGLLGGAAVGAGTVYATSPKVVTLEPAEVVEIRLTDDVPRSIFLGNR
ncbi:MAG: hypothetical protein F6K35_44110 [Okeania sp. SIO2H7]|nr:hypothetical protein [Okeania sp. SIO2H7]